MPKNKEERFEMEINGKRSSISASRIKKGPICATKYDPSTYPQIAKAELSKMHSLVAVCAALQINKSTYYDWVDKHEEFRQAVEEGKLIGETRFEGKAVDNFENKNFNAVLWQMYGRRVYGYTETRAVRVEGMKEGMTYEQEIDCIMRNVSDGHLTPKEGTEMATIVSTKAKTYEQVEAKKLLEEIAKTMEKR